MLTFSTNETTVKTLGHYFLDKLPSINRHDTISRQNYSYMYLYSSRIVNNVLVYHGTIM